MRKSFYRSGFLGQLDQMRNAVANDRRLRPNVSHGPYGCRPQSLPSSQETSCKRLATNSYETPPEALDARHSDQPCLEENVLDRSLLWLSAQQCVCSDIHQTPTLASRASHQEPFPTNINAQRLLRQQPGEMLQTPRCCLKHRRAAIEGNAAIRVRSSSTFGSGQKRNSTFVARHRMCGCRFGV